MSPVRAIFVPFPPKTGTSMLHPRPRPPIFELVAEAATCGTEEALKRRARRTHCERPCGNPDAMGYVQQRSRFGFVCVVTVEGYCRWR